VRALLGCSVLVALDVSSLLGNWSVAVVEALAEAVMVIFDVWLILTLMTTVTAQLKSSTRLSAAV
jgi:hypothetical protein